MFLTIITFILVLSVLVFAHELGHFMMARKFGVRAEEFGFGFPPRIFGLQVWREQRLKKNAESENIAIGLETRPLPDGSKIIKEIIIDEKKEIDEAFWIRKFRFIKGSREITPDEEKYGTVYSINWLPLGGFVKIKGENGEGETEPDSFASRPIWQRAFMLSAGVVMNIILAAVLIIAGFTIGLPQSLDGQLDARAHVSDKAFYDLLKGLILGQGVTADLPGPVGIATLTGQVARMGFVYLLQFTALLSINLAVINFFPFPALDGGRILFLIIEKIKRSPVKREVEGAIHNIGFALLMVLILVVTLRDVSRFGGFFKGILERIF
ncbi:site-2 protease family protein [Candidatus Falkowbacteria bacterium]|nr:site-2 protease family protein [Candidatus Falkowbacteria bacterium]